MGARVLVCGGRTYSDRAFAFKVLDTLHREHQIELLIHGDARGADRLGALWAFERKVPQKAFPAKWGNVAGLPPHTLRRNRAGKLYNPLAGFERNQEMLQACPTHAVAFPGGNGTDDMCRRIFRAIGAGQEIEFIDYRGALA